jgi:hypothetical protein
MEGSQGHSKTNSETVPGNPHMSSEFADSVGFIDQEERGTSKLRFDGKRCMAQSASIAKSY